MASLLSRTIRRITGGPVSRRAIAAASEKWADDPATFSATADVHGAAELVGARTAGLVLNDAVAASAVDLIDSNIVGSGVRLNTSDQETDAAFNGGKLDPSRRSSPLALQSAAIRSWAISGEIVGIHRNAEDGYAFQLLHPSQLDRAKNEDRGGGGYILNGVEFDNLGRIVAYWLIPQALNTPFATVAESVRFDVRDVVHCFIRQFPGQVRGISPFTAVLPMLNTASVTTDAMSKRMQLAGSLFGTITTPDDGAGPFEGDGSNPKIEPMTWARLRVGEDIKTFQGADVGDFSAVQKGFYRLIAAGLGVTYEDLCGDLEGVNYSSFRGDALTARRKAEARRRLLIIEGLLEPIFERWQAHRILSGEGGQPLRPSWIEPSWPAIDPQKEIGAEITALNARLKSRKEIIEARGREFETVVAEIEADPLPLAAVEDST